MNCSATNLGWNVKSLVLYLISTFSMATGEGQVDLHEGIGIIACWSFGVSLGAVITFTVSE
jgi:hypothetical protein